MESSMHSISSQDESWFPVFDWRGEPTFHQHLKWSFPSAIAMGEGPCVFCLKWNGSQEAQTQMKARFPCIFWNSGSSFISQDERMSESPVETLEKAVGVRPIWTWASYPFDLSRGTPNSMFYKVTMPDTSWKWIGIPISQCQIKSEPLLPHLQKRLYCSAKIS